MPTPLRILLVGAAGRMGRAVSAAAAAQRDNFEITARCDRGDSVEHAIGDCDAVIEFGDADASEATCAVCTIHRKPLVIGTTGHSDAQLGAIAQAANTIPIVHAANFSVGVNTLFWLARKTAELLGAGYDIEVIETHHRHKKDAPSGTAKRLVQLLAEVRGLDLAQQVVHGRAGQVGERPPSQIGVHAIRAGDVVGDHTALFAAAGERLELTHKASSRDTFALGALRAAQWVIGKPDALYNMEDVLGLSDRAR